MIGLQRLAFPSCPPAKCPPAKRPPFSLDLPAVIVVFIDILPNWGLFGIIKQICQGSVGILMECLPSGGWFFLGLCPRENHPPSGRHSIRIPTLPWHICILSRNLTYLRTNCTFSKKRGILCYQRGTTTLCQLSIKILPWCLGHCFLQQTMYRLQRQMDYTLRFPCISG